MAISLAAGPVTSGTASADSSPFVGQRPVVTTEDGDVRGTLKAQYAEFKGIPYAKAPVGELRWRAPQEPDSWPGVRDATQFGGSCTQGSGWDPGYEEPTYNEDCLNLNVYSPASPRIENDREDGLPVLVWIHGGGNRGGAGRDTFPARFVEETQTVFVTLNYRLGALGYLDTAALDAESAGDGSAGNYGILDQQMALRWVRDNIAAFGGNPADVTIAGQSAGGSNTCTHLAAPASRGLFQRAIIQSGGCSGRTEEAAQSDGAAFAERLGCVDPASQTACLRSKTPEEVLAAQGNFSGGAVVDGTVVPQDPREALRQGRVAQVPVLIGSNSDESQQSVFGAYDYQGNPLTPEGYESLVRSTYPAVADRVLAEYPVADHESPTVAWGTVQSDARACRDESLFADFARVLPTYAYEFAEREGPAFTSIWRLDTDYPFGATHVNELGYLWDYLGTHLPFSNEQEDLSSLMGLYWAQFTDTGDPNAPTAPAWPLLQDSGALMQFTAAESRMIPIEAHAAAHHCGLWSPVVNS
ncbi:carboxylesterase/lipase family protein [Kineococcus arenarius]|uniref:carboxylesterase/lipase family protein n=1 Tax=unclassified Kineococcus TaxID=2621656 RepID=UPI003D7DAA05